MNIFAYLIPLGCGFVVALASMFVKRASEEGAGITRILFITNWLFLLMLLPAYYLNPEIKDMSRWWVPVGTSIITFLAGVFILASVRTGDVTVQTPLMGTKVVFVATYSLFLIPGGIPLGWWVGVFLTFIAILILGLKDLITKKHSILSIVYALLSSALFGLTDVIVSREAENFGKWPFLTIMVGCMALESIVLIPFFRKSLWKIHGRTWAWVFLGAGCLSLQHGGLLYALSKYGMPTALNILYSSRGVWSIALVWFVGHWFKSEEKARVGKGTLARRLIGSLLLTAAIVTVLIDHQ